MLHPFECQIVVLLEERYKKKGIFIEKLIKNREFNKKPDFNRVIK
jgi:hypothetical protein